MPKNRGSMVYKQADSKHGRAGGRRLAEALQDLRELLAQLAVPEHALGRAQNPRPLPSPLLTSTALPAFPLAQSRPLPSSPVVLKDERDLIHQRASSYTHLAEMAATRVHF